MKPAPAPPRTRSNAVQNKEDRAVPSHPQKTAIQDPEAEARLEQEIASLAKRHRVSPAIIREIIRRSGSSEKSSIERELQKSKARR